MAEPPSQPPHLSLRGLAEKLGVSRTTVSRALNDKPEVSEVTRQLVQKAAQELGYTPSAAMSAAMKSAGSRGRLVYRETIGCITMQQPLNYFERAEAENTNEYPQQRRFLKGLTDRCREIGCKMDYFTLQSLTPERLSKVLETRGIERLIYILPARYFLLEQYQRMRRIALQYYPVYLGYPGLGWTRETAVLPDLFTAGNQVALEAWKAGYQKLYFSSTLRSLDRNDRFLSGLRAPFLRAHGSVQVEQLHPDQAERLLDGDFRFFSPESCVIGAIAPDKYTRLKTILATPGAPQWIDWHANLHQSRFSLSGIDQRDEEQARFAVDLCMSATRYFPSNSDNELGRAYFLEPTWIEGTTLKKLQRPHDGLGRLLNFSTSQKQEYITLPLPKSQLQFPLQMLGHGHSVTTVPLPKPGDFVFHHVPFRLDADSKANDSRPLFLPISQHQDFPEALATAKVAVKRMARAIYFLHLGYGCRQSAETGSYHVVFEDGTQIKIPIIASDYDGTLESTSADSIPIPNIQDWWPEARPLKTPTTLPVRLYFDERQKDTFGYIYLHMWENPHPEKVITHVKVCAQPGQRSLLLLLGLTCGI